MVVLTSDTISGLVFEIKRFAVHDGPGIRTTVFLKGCPLRCAWCHNPEGISFEPEIAVLERRCEGCGACFAACPRGLHTVDPSGVHRIDRSHCDMCGACVKACLPQALKLFGVRYTPEELLGIVKADIDFYNQSGGGVTCSGGEALAQPDFTAAFLRLCKEAGIHTAVDTAGLAPWRSFEAALPYTDLFLYDIKHMSPAKHLELTGADNRLILENLASLSRHGSPVEIRLLVIPGYNDDEDNLRRTAELLKEIRSLTLIRPLPYHALSGSKYAAIGDEYRFIGATGGELDAAKRVGLYLEREGLPVAHPD